MWFWGHAAVGYLAYRAYRWFRARNRQDAAGGPLHGLPLAALLLGTQLPDLVDKPLAWWFGLLPAGRSLLHSLVVVLPLSALAVWLARRRGTDRSTPVTWAVVAGVLSHVVADALPQVALGEIAALSYLAWPLLPAPGYDVGAGFGPHFAAITLGPGTLFELALTMLSLGLAIHHELR